MPITEVYETRDLLEPSINEDPEVTRKLEGIEVPSLNNLTNFALEEDLGIDISSTTSQSYSEINFFREANKRDMLVASLTVDNGTLYQGLEV